MRFVQIGAVTDVGGHRPNPSPSAEGRDLWRGPEGPGKLYCMQVCLCNGPHQRNIAEGIRVTSTPEAWALVLSVPLPIS